MGPGLRLEMHTHECVACGAGLAHNTPRGSICAQCSMEGLTEAMQAVSDSNAREAAERTERGRARRRMCPACFINCADQGVCGCCSLAGRTERDGVVCDRCGARFGWGGSWCSNNLCQDARRQRLRSEGKGQPENEEAR